MDVAAITALTKLLFDGLAVLIVFALYIRADRDRKNEQKKDKERYQKITDEIQENYNSMIKDIVQGVSGRHLTPEESKNIVIIDKQVNDIINNILKEVNASRVSIVKYHNGNKDMTGKSFLKMSMTNEVVNIGVAPMMGEFKELFRSLLAYWCHELELYDSCIIADTEDIKNIDITMYQYLTSRNIEASYGYSLKDNYGNIIGYINIEYLNKDDFNLKKISEIMKTNLPKLQTLMSINGGGANEL